MIHLPPRLVRSWAGPVLLGLVLAVLSVTPAAPAAEPTPIMPLDEVRVGMKGYGLTVFHGDTIEPFACHVVSVISDSSAKRATIWIECTDERMQRSGPVQGMSGSPIYLWDEDDNPTPTTAHVPGEGGRLIGAFAFGYPDVNVCLVGVQPIEYMLEVGDRAKVEPLDEPQARRFDPRRSEQRHRELASLATQLNVPMGQRRQLEAVKGLIGGKSSKPASTPDPLGHSAHEWGNSAAPAPAVPGGGDLGGILPLRLPLAVGDEQTARLLAPLLAPSGIQVMAGDLTSIAGSPPSNVDPSRVRLEPGSVLSIPLAYGDVDFNAAGTVTDVLPDGTVLGFGHAMDAIGSSRLPMANGYTHFVVSRNSISFKRGSSLDIVGSIVRDEASAVAGVPDTAFFAAPVSVAVNLPSQPPRQYNYHVVDDPQLTPAILAAVTNASLTAVQGPPVFHTTRLQANVNFAGGRSLSFDRVIPASGMNGLVYEMLPVINALTENPFESLRVEAAEIDLDIVEGIQAAELFSATLDRPVVQPGDTVQITVRLEPYDQPEATLTFPFVVPSDMPEGEHPLVISDYSGYLNRLVNTDPRFQDVTDIDQLAEALQVINDTDEQAVFVALVRPRPGISVGRQAFDHLPASRAAVLGAAATSAVVQRPTFVEASYDTDWVVSGELMVTLKVQQTPP